MLNICFSAAVFNLARVPLPVYLGTFTATDTFLALGLDLNTRPPYLREHRKLVQPIPFLHCPFYFLS